MVVDTIVSKKEVCLLPGLPAEAANKTEKYRAEELTAAQRIISQTMRENKTVTI